MIQLTLTLKISTMQVVETSVTVNNSPIQDVIHLNDRAPPTFVSFFVSLYFSTLKVTVVSHTVWRKKRWFSPLELQTNWRLCWYNFFGGGGGQIRFIVGDVKMANSLKWMKCKTVVQTQICNGLELFTKIS